MKEKITIKDEFEAIENFVAFQMVEMPENKKAQCNAHFNGPGVDLLIEPGLLVCLVRSVFNRIKVNDDCFFVDIRLHAYTSKVWLIVRYLGERVDTEPVCEYLKFTGEILIKHYKGKHRLDFRQDDKVSEIEMMMWDI